MTRSRAISLFSNCGAGDLGFRQAGFEFVVMAELDPRRLDVALRNHPGAEGVEGDLRRTWPKVIEKWRARSGDARPSLVAACPPCQGMSTARSDRGSESDPDAGTKDDRNLLVLPITEVVKSLEPDFVVVENVPAFLRRKVRHPDTGDGVSAAKLLIDMLASDYLVHPIVTDLADYGVPQTRKRAFLTFVRRAHPMAAVLTELGAVAYPVPTHAADHGGSPVHLKQAMATFGLRPLDAVGEARSRDPDHPLHFVPVWDDRQYAMVAAIPPGSGASAWQNDTCPECGEVAVGEDDATCPQCGQALLRPIVQDEDGIRLVNGFRRSSYRRMDPDAPAATITTASGRVSSSRTIHPEQNRVLSPLECALLQTIPSDFDWGDSLERYGVMGVRAMIGEAVPPLFTRKHGCVLRQLLAEKLPSNLLTADDPRCRHAWEKLGPPRHVAS